MIRFCDKEVCCVTENELDRQQLLTYFLNGNRTQTVCILDEAGKFTGSITYDTLLGKDLQDAVSKEYIFFDENIWECGRRYFRNGEKEFGGVKLLPVLDKEHQLLCFAWQDEEANREIRMLDELTECQDALTFLDIYPEFDGVSVHGCNELAYYLVKYLKKSGVMVQVTGALWDNFTVINAGSNSNILDYKKYEVYAEGTECPEEKAEQRKSVSAEFECIDRIYEENIKNGKIEDTDGNFQNLLDRIRGRQIVITGNGEELLNAYDLLIGNDVDIECFVSDKKGEQGKVIFGKIVLRKEEAMTGLENAVFIETGYQYSAWGFGGTDFYHYFGYKRNRDFYLLQDYAQIPKNGLRNLLCRMLDSNEKRLVLTGDRWLCLKLFSVLKSWNTESVYEKAAYCDILDEYSEENIMQKGRIEMPQIPVDEICETDRCLFLQSEYYGYYLDDATMIRYRDTRRTEYRERLMRTKAVEIIDYAAENTLFMDTHNTFAHNTSLKIGKIVIGSINYHSGNLFFRGLLDSHPNIIMINDNYLNRNLFFICIQLAMVKSADILNIFWNLINSTFPA